MSLLEYRRKRRFESTTEPRGGKTARRVVDRGLAYVVQKHQASRLHYDFRLGWRGVLLSWAVPKGPSLDPSIKRMAVRTEDHPEEYASFEGVIPADEYGAGTVMIWDHGTWIPEDADVDAALRKGAFKFTLKGRKLKGSWALVQTGAAGPRGKSGWLLIKHRDRFAKVEDVLRARPRSTISRRLLADIARDEGGDVERAAAGDPRNPSRQATRGTRAATSANRPAQRKRAARPGESSRTSHA